jgi:hypothetical protein
VPRYHYAPGDIAHTTIVAPFSFNVLKSELMIETEVMTALQSFVPQYLICEEIKFHILKQLDDFFIDLKNVPSGGRDQLLSILEKYDYEFSEAFIKNISSENQQNYIYQHLSVRLSGILALPIISDEDIHTTYRILSTHAQQDTENQITISEAKQRIVRGIVNPEQVILISEILDILLKSNLVIDSENLNRERNIIRRSIDPVLSRVEANDYIIQKNDRISELEILKLASFTKALSQMKKEKTLLEIFSNIIGFYLINAFLLSIFYFITLTFFPPKYLLLNRILLCYGAIILNVMISTILYYTFSLPYVILVPIPMFVITIALIFSPRYAIIFSFLVSIISSQYLHWDMLPMINLTISSLICLMLIRKQKRHSFLLIFIYLLASLTVFTIITGMYRFESLISIWYNLLYGLINSVVSVICAMLLTTIIEKKLGFVTQNLLHSLIDITNPLLKRLSKEAQGTYYHCVIVGNLAEECAEAIHANPMIARVGSYYHDIGKLECPEYYSENGNKDNLHEHLSPIESATIIKSHIKNGVAIAKKARLPVEITDIIEQHHGDGRIKYFHYKAKEKNMEFAESDFYYAGPKPKTKEATIVMIADIVESTTKSSDDQSEVAIKKIIDDSINNLYADDQLADAPITLAELSVIKKTMLPILCSIYTKRVPYPKDTD